MKKNDKLAQGQLDRLDELGFVWDPYCERWEKAYEELQKYKAEHGDVLVPYSYLTASGFNLGRWVDTQRRKKKNGKLTQGQLDRLDELGFVWDPYREQWENGYEELQKYKAEHGDVSVPQSYQTASGFNLGTWVTKQRALKKLDRLTEDQIERLDELGFVWNPHREQWENGYEELQKYKAEHGDVWVPQSYQTANGSNLGTWVTKQRTLKKLDKLTQDQIERLDELGFVWNPHREQWENGYEELQKYKAEHGDVWVPQSRRTASGFNLGTWVTKQRKMRKGDKLNQGQIERLDELGFVWDPYRERWENGYEELQKYKAEHGDVLVPQSCKTASGFNLGRWVDTQRKMKKSDKLTQDQIERLDELGFVWNPHREQ
eukprot:Skav201907  [mRNA]  locus=scaffold3992:66369:67490:+ [translate_table: standard]